MKRSKDRKYQKHQKHQKQARSMRGKNTAGMPGWFRFQALPRFQVLIMFSLADGTTSASSNLVSLVVGHALGYACLHQGCRHRQKDNLSRGNTVVFPIQPSLRSNPCSLDTCLDLKDSGLRMMFLPIARKRSSVKYPGSSEELTEKYP